MALTPLVMNWKEGDEHVALLSSSEDRSATMGQRVFDGLLFIGNFL